MFFKEYDTKYDKVFGGIVIIEKIGLKKIEPL